MFRSPKILDASHFRPPLRCETMDSQSSMEESCEATLPVTKQVAKEGHHQNDKGSHKTDQSEDFNSHECQGKDAAYFYDVELSTNSPSSHKFSSIGGGVLVPFAGESNGGKAATQTSRGGRYCENSCSICFSHFKTAQEISWSSNEKCRHVFHSPCIQQWLETVSQRYLARQARTRLPRDTIQSLLVAPMACPVCRQAFLLRDKEADEETLHNLLELGMLSHGAFPSSSFPVVQLGLGTDDQESTTPLDPPVTLYRYSSSTL